MTWQRFYQSALVLLVLALVTIKEAQGGACPAGTIEMNNKCFWRGAQVDGCTAHAGGKLAVLPTAKDVKDAAKHLKGLFVGAGNPVELKIALVRTGRKWHWVGFNRKENNNKCWRDNSHKKPPIKRCASAEYDNADKKVYFLPRKCDVNGDCLCYVELPKDDDGGETNNDPHFLITSLDSDNTHFCFDVDGGDDDVLQLLQDPDHKLQVNGQLFESQGTFHHAFFSAIAIMYGDDEIISTKDNITINGDRTVQWDDSYSIDLDNQGSVSSLDKSTAWIELASDIQMEITRTKTSDNDSYLGFFLTHTGGIGDRAKGVMGKFIGSKFSAVQSTDKHSQWVIEFSQLPISVPVNQLTRYSHSHQKRIQCWHYKVDTNASEDALLGKRTEYTVDDLEYTPF